MGKIHIDETSLYVIRAEYEGFSNRAYYQSPMSWTLDHCMATLFRDFEVAEDHMFAAYKIQGEEGVTMDIVPYSGELLAFQNPK